MNTTLGTGSSVTIASGKTLSNIMSYGSSDALTLENMVNDASIAITNSGTISASSDNARGIYVYGTLFPTSVISNTSTGTISATGRDVSRGIYVSGAAINSQILNSGEITASSTNDDILNEIHPISTGIYLGALQSVGTEADNGSENSKLSNNGTLNSTANSTIETTVMGTTYSYGNIISDAKGIYVSTLTGVADELFPVIENSNDIRVESKINIDFANEEDILNMNNSALNALSTGVEVGSSSYGVINNQEHATITSLAQIDINPNGTINGYFGAISNGIKINESFISSSLMNSGAIDSQAIFNGTNESYALSNGILLDNDDGEISNSNVISNNIISKALATSTNTNSGAFSEASGIRVETDITGDANAIGSYGIMSVESKANSNYWSQAEGTGIYINADSTKLTVQNGVDWNGVQDTNAKITVNVEATTQTGHSYAEAYGINISDFEDSTMINNGTIKVTATANSYDYSVANATGISVGYSNIGNFINNGTITVKANTTIAQLGEETDAPNANGIFANNSDELNLTNTGTIEAYINGMLDEKGKSLNISGDSVTVINSGTLKGNIFVEGSLVNSGTIELPYNAVDAYVSDFTNTSTGKLTIGVMSGTEKDGFGNLVIQHSKLETESATFENGSTLGVNVLTLSGNQNLLKGQTLYNVVKATDHLNLNGTLNVTDNSALLDFSYKATNINVDAEHINGEAGAIHLNVVKGQTVSESVEAAVSEAAKNISPKVTQYTNAQGAAKAFDKIIDNIDNNPRMNSVITRLNQLSSNEAVARAVESTTPVAANATVGATTQISNGIAGIVTQRQNANISGGMNSGDGMFSENNMWIKPFGSIGSQNDKDGINGFDVKTYGLGFGADTEYKNNQKLGVAFFYTNANVDVNNMNQNADLDVFTTLVYGNVPIIDDKTNFLYQVGYSWQNTQTDREVFTGDKAESKYTSKTASLDLKLMRDVNVNKDLLLQPLVNTTYRHFTNPAYNETGADALNLNVDKFTSTDLIVGLGTLAHYKLDKESKIVGNVNVGYDLHDKNQTVTSAYEGASGVSFETQGIDNGRWSYEAGIGYEKDISATSAINVAYDYQGQGTDFSNNIISAKYVLKF